jgi:hypothetical protein
MYSFTMLVILLNGEREQFLIQSAEVPRYLGLAVRYLLRLRSVSERLSSFCERNFISNIEYEKLHWLRCLKV